MVPELSSMQFEVLLVQSISASERNNIATKLARYSGEKRQALVCSTASFNQMFHTPT